MGFWSSLGSLAGIALSPFTAGASIPIGSALGGIGDSIANHGDAIGDVGTVLGKDAAAAAQGRAEQAKLQQGQDSNALNFYNSELRAPSTSSSQAVRGALLKNLQDATISGLPARISVPQIGGGLRPSALGADKGAIGQSLFSNAMGNLRNMKPLTPPSVTPLPDASAWDKIAQTGGRIGAIAGAASPLLRHPNGGGSPYTGPDYGPSLEQLLGGGGGDNEDFLYGFGG